MSFVDPFKPLENVTIILTEEQLIELNEWFDHNSLLQLIVNYEDVVNVITVDKLKEFLELKKYHRRNFHYPTYAQIMKEVENFKTSMVTKDQFVYMVNKWTKLPVIKHEIKLAFSVFDTEKRNYLDIDEIQTLVTSYGDAFNKEEIRELLRDANVRGDGNVYYNDFIDSLFNLAPELHNIKVEYLYENPDEDPSVPPGVPVIEEPVYAKPMPSTPNKKKKGKK